MTSPFMQARKPSSATSSTLPTTKPGNLPSSWLDCRAWLSMGVAVMPGHRAVTVMPVPLSSSDSDSVSDNT